MKGRLLTIKELANLKSGDKVYIEPIHHCKYNEGLAIVEKDDMKIILTPTNGERKTPWILYIDSQFGVQNGIWLDVYEWVEENKQPQTNKSIQNRINELKQEMQELENKLAEQNIKEDIASCTIHRIEDSCFEQYISKSKAHLESKVREMDYTVSYRRDGSKIICEFTNGASIGVGTAKCNPEDKFNYNTGMVIAELRARENFYKKVAKNIINYI